MEEKRLIQVLNFSECQDDFLNFIETDHPSNNIVKEYDGDEISKTTYFDSPNQPRLIELYNKHFDPFLKKIIPSNFEMNTIWYQIYYKKSGSFHEYHTHINTEHCHVSGVYYVKLVDNSIVTKFMLHGEEFQPEAEEGDLVLFDASIPHTSPPNHTDHDKIIVSFNLRVI
jgi:hypothetical protein